MDQLEQICVTKDNCFMKKGLKKTNTYVGKLVGILLKLFTCKMMVAQTKLVYGYMDGFERYPGVWIDRIWQQVVGERERQIL